MADLFGTYWDPRIARSLEEYLVVRKKLAEAQLKQVEQETLHASARFNWEKDRTARESNARAKPTREMLPSTLDTPTH